MRGVLEAVRYRLELRNQLTQSEERWRESAVKSSGCKRNHSRLIAIGSLWRQRGQIALEFERFASRQRLAVRLRASGNARYQALSERTKKHRRSIRSESHGARKKGSLDGIASTAIPPESVRRLFRRRMNGGTLRRVLADFSKSSRL